MKVVIKMKMYKNEDSGNNIVIIMQRIYIEDNTMMSKRKMFRLEILSR